MIPLQDNRRSPERAAGMNFATLPGVGQIEEPRAEHYRAAIKWIRDDLRRHPPPGYDRHRRGDDRYVLLLALHNTLRRLEWTPARLRAARIAHF